MMTDVNVPDPLVGLCHALYGDLVDPAVVWNVAKFSPGPSDLSTPKPSPKERMVRGAGIAATAAGGVLGVKELGGGMGLSLAGGKLVRTGGMSARKLALGGTALGGDIIATGVQAEDALDRRKAAQAGGVAKLNLLEAAHTGENEIPKFTDTINGMRRSFKNITDGIKTKFTPQNPPRPGSMAAAAEQQQRQWTRTERNAGRATSQEDQMARDKAKTRWGNAGGDLGSFMGTTTGKITAGGAVAAGGLAANKAIQNRKSQQLSYVPDGYDTYAKAEGNDVTFTGTFSKLDEDQRLAFGWASVTKLNGTPVVDRQGDYIAIEDIEKAAYDYVHKSRVGGDMHKRTDDDRAHHVSDMVESIVFTDDKVKKMGLPDDFPRGWWVGFKIHDDATWDLVKKGERTGFSIHGKGVRKDHDLDELMGYAHAG